MPSCFPLPRLHWLAALGAFTAAACAHAQTNIIVFNTHYQATDIQPWADDIGGRFDHQLSWGTSASFGGFSSGWFGDEWGVGGTASINVGLGIRSSFTASAGKIGLDIANKIQLAFPADNNADSPTIAITQNRSTPSGNYFTASAPNFAFDFGFNYNIDARVDGRIAYGWGSTSGSITLDGVTAFLAGTSGNPIVAGAIAAGYSPYRVNLNNLVAFDGATNTASILGYTMNAGNGIVIPISPQNILPIYGHKIPTAVRLGTVTINPTSAELNAQSGTGFTTSSTKTTVLAGSLDLLGLASTALGLPINPFDIRLPIGGSRLELDLKLLSLSPHFDLGIRQDLTLAPNTYLNLTSNYAVTYLINGQKVVTTNLSYLLPNSGAASAVQIVGRPEASDWQLFSSISFAPQIRNQLYLTFTEGFDIEALQIRLSAFGIGGGIGPLINEDFTITQSVLLFDEWAPLAGGTLSRVYRSPIPLFGAGVTIAMPEIAKADLFQMVDGAGTYNTSSIRGTMQLINSYFQGSNPISLSGTLALQSDHVEDSSLFEVPGLTPTSTGVLLIEPNNKVILSSETPGFVNAQGHVANGTYLIAGALSYKGPMIHSIGAGVTFQLLPSAYETDLEIGHRIDNNGLDAFSSLGSNAGTLIVAGQNLQIASTTLNNSGTFALLNGYTVSANTFNNTGTLAIGAGSTFQAGSLGTNFANGSLNSGTWILGDASGAGRLLYAGAPITGLGANARVTLAGARPSTGGYFTRTGSDDALTGLVASAGALSLVSGARQTVAANFRNSGTLSLASGTALAVGGSLGNLSTIEGLSTLSAGTWNIAGTLDYTGASIAAIAGNTSVTLDGTGRFDNGANALRALSRLDGTLNLVNGASLTSSGTLAASANAKLNLASGTSLTVGGISALPFPFTLANGATLTTGGLPVDAQGRLTVDQLTLSGTLNHNAANKLAGLADNKRLNLTSTGRLLNNGANGFAAFSDLAGILDLTGGGVVRTDATLALTGSGILFADANTHLTVTGASLTVASGAYLQSAGRLTLGGGAHQTNFTINPNYTLATRTELGALNATNGNHTATTGSGRLTGTGAWTNTGSILGAGAITGGTLTNRGTLNAVGGTLALSGFAAPIANYGTLGSFGAGGLLRLDGVTLNNLTESNTTGGLLVQSGLQAVNGTAIHGGVITVNNGATFTSAGSTLNLTRLSLDGTMTVQTGAATSLAGNLAVGRTGILTLDPTATLAFTGADPSLANLGTINFGGGSRISGLSVQNQGTINLGSGTTNLSNVINDKAGTINLANGSILALAGPSFANGGLISLSGESTVSHSTLRLSGDLTLTGGGSIRFGGEEAGSGTVETTGGNHTLTLAEQSLLGRGQFGRGQIAIENLAGGTIGAYGGLLDIETNSGGFLNQGTLEVGGGAALRIHGGAFRSLDANGNLSEGTYRVAGTLQIDDLNATEPFTSSVAITLNGADAKIVDGANQTVGVASLTSTGSLSILNKTYTLANPFSNAGTLTAGTGGIINLNGGLTNFSGTTLTGGRFVAAGTLRFSGADIVTNASDLTLRTASGSFQNTSGQNALRNFSTNLGRFTLLDGATHTVGASVAHFTQAGKLIVGEGSAFDTGSAAITNTGTPDYWIGGTLRGTNNPLASGSGPARLTLSGTGAAWQVNGTAFPGAVSSPTSFLGSIGTGSTLTLAGGYRATFAPGTTLTNNGTLEIGSPDALAADGTRGRSNAYVTFGSASSSDFAVINGGTTRLYAGTGTADATDFTHGFDTANNFFRGIYINRLRVNGTLDANGIIDLAPGGQLDLHGTFTNTLANTVFTQRGTPFASQRGTVNIIGGLDLVHSLGSDAGNPVNINFTYTGGSALHLDGASLVIDNLSLSSINTGSIRLANNSSIKNSAGASLLNFSVNSSSGTLALQNQQLVISSLGRNEGTINLQQSASLGSHVDFVNVGTINGTGSSSFALLNPRQFLNRGTINGGSYSGSTDFSNGYGDYVNNAYVSYTGRFLGSVNASGTVTNTAGSTFTGSATGASIRNYGVMEAESLTAVGDRYAMGIFNAGQLTTSGRWIRNAVWVPQGNGGYYNYYDGFIANIGSGTLTFTGGPVVAAISSEVGARIRINDPSGTAFETRFTSPYNDIRGPVYLDSGYLHLYSATDINHADLIAAGGTRLDVENLTLNNFIALNGTDLRTGATGATIDRLSLAGSNTITGNLLVNYLGVNSGSGLTLTGHLRLGEYQPMVTFDSALTGLGTLRFEGNNRHLALNGGSTLRASNADYLLPSLFLEGSGSTLYLGGSNAEILSAIQNAGTTRVTGNVRLIGQLGGTGSLNVQSGAALDVLTQQAYTGGTTNAGTLTLGGSFITGNVDNSGTVKLDGPNNYTIGSDLTFTGGTLAKTGGNTVTLHTSRIGDNLLVSSGTLVLNPTSLAGTTLSSITNHATFEITGTGSGSNYAATAGGTGAFRYSGLGRLGLTLTGSAAGGVSLTGGGTLALNAPALTGTIDVHNGTLSVFSDANLGVAPTSFTTQLLVNRQGTLAVAGHTTLAGTRGVWIGDGATFNIDGSLTIPTALTGNSYDGVSRYTLNKTGGGSLNLVAPADHLLGFNVAEGTLSLTNDRGYTYTGSGLSVGSSATFRAMGGEIDLTALNGNSVQGALFIGSGATLRYHGSAGAVANEGTFTTYRDDVTFSAITNTGTFNVGYGSGTGTTVADSVTGSGTVILNNSASLDVGNLTASSLQLQNSSRLAVDTGLIYNLSLTGTGTLDIADRLRVYGTFTPPQFGSAQITQNGEGTLEFSNSGDLNAHFTLNAGTLQAGPNTTFNGTLSGTGSFVINAGQNGVVNFNSYSIGSAFPNDHTGGTFVQSGTLWLGTQASLGGTIHADAGTTVVYSNSAYTLADIKAQLTGPGTLGKAGNHTLYLDDDLSWTDETDSLRHRDLTLLAGTVEVGFGGGAGIGAIRNDAALNFFNTSPLTLDGVISGSGIINQNNNSLTLTANNTFAGTYNINSGTLTLTGLNTGAATANIAQFAALTLGGDSTFAGTIVNHGTLNYNRSGNFTMAALFSGNGLFSFGGGGTLTLTSAPNYDGAINIADGSTLAFAYNNVGATETKGYLNNTVMGDGSLLKLGTGTLVLAADNQFHGVTTIRQGTLQLGNGGSTGSLAGGFVLESGGTLAYNFGSDRIFNGAIEGNGSIWQRGAGKITFAVDQAYYGQTLIDRGSTLQLGVGGDTGNLAGTLAFDGVTLLAPHVVNHGTLIFNLNTGVSGYTSNITSEGTGRLEQRGLGTLTLTGLHTATGGAYISAGTTIALAQTGSITGLIDNQGTLEIVTGGARNLDNLAITGPGGLTLTGTGSVRLSGALGYTGTTALGDATLNFYANGDSILGTAITSNAGSALNIFGPGRLIVTADSAGFHGHAFISDGGTLRLGNGGTTGALGSIAASGQITNYGMLEFNRSDDLILGAEIAGDGGIRQMGVGSRLFLTDTTRFLGRYAVDTGSMLYLQHQNSGMVGTYNTLHVDGNLYLQQASPDRGTWRIAGDVSGSGTIGRADGAFSNIEFVSAPRIPTLSNPATGDTGLNFTGLVENYGGRILVYSNGTMGSFAADYLDVFGNLAVAGNSGSTYMRTTIANGATLTLGNGGTSGFVGGLNGTSDGQVTNHGTLAVDRSDTVTLNLTGPGYGGSGRLKQAGSGTTVLATSLFEGAIDITQGVLELPENAAVTGVITNHATLRLSGGHAENAALITGTGGIDVVADASLNGNLSYTGATAIAEDQTLTISAHSTTLTGDVTGTGNLVVNDGHYLAPKNGVLTLANGASYTGTTSLSGMSSNIALNVTGTFASSQINGAGTFRFTTPTDTTLTTALHDEITFRKLGAGTLTLVNTNNTNHETFVEAGTLSAGASGVFAPQLALNLAAGAGIRLNGHDQSIGSLHGLGSVDLGSARLALTHGGGALGGNITGTGGITIASHSAGLVLSGHNTYTGGTRVEAGTLGLASSTALAPGSVFLGNGSTLRISADTIFTSASPLILDTLGAALDVDWNRTVTFNTGIHGSGSLYFGGGGVMALDVLPTNTGGIHIGAQSTLRLSADTIDYSNIHFTNGALDLNGLTRTAGLNAGITGGILANSSANTASFAGHYTANGTVLGLRSTGGDLIFAGTTDATHLAVEGGGRSIFAASTSDIARISADSGTLVLEDTAGLGNLSRLDVTRTGAVEFAGENNLTLAISGNLTLNANGATGDTAGLFNRTAGTTATLNVADEILFFATGGPSRSNVLLGGAGDLTLTGVIGDGNGNVAKVGAGKLTFNVADASLWWGDLDLREGTLAGTAAFFNGRSLALTTGTGVEFLSGATTTLAGLSGTGSVAFAANGLMIAQNTDTTFAGTLSGTGALTRTGTGSLTLGGNVTAGSVNIGDNGSNASYEYLPKTTFAGTGTLATGAIAINGGTTQFDAATTATSITVNGGRATFTNLQSANLPMVIGENANGPGDLTVNASAVTNGAAFTGNVDIAGWLTLSGLTQHLTTNAGTLVIRGSSYAGQFGSDNSFRAMDAMTGNTGTLRILSSAQNAVAVNFANHGTVEIAGNIGNGNATLNLGFGGASTFTQTAGSLTIGTGGALNARNLVINGGTVRLDGTFGSSGSSLLTLNHGATLTSNGSITGSGFVMNGGTFSPGTLGTVGGAGGAVPFARDATLNGGTYVWNIADATGAAGVGYDTIRLARNLTLGATAANPFAITIAPVGTVANFNPDTNYAWSLVRGSVDGNGSISGFSADKFLIDAEAFTAATGNFGLATSTTPAVESGHEHHLQVVYNWSHVFNVASGSQLESTALAANGQFGGLRKTGAGTLVLTGNTLFTGLTRLDAGTLQLGNGGTTGSILGDVVNHGTLAFNRSDALTFANKVSGTGALLQDGSGTLTLSGANTYAGGTTVAAGTLSVASDAALGAANGTFAFTGGTLAATSSFTAHRATTLSGRGTFDTASGVTLTWDGDISGDGTLNKLGLGTLQLGGNNTYSGVTNVNAGTLRLGSAAALSPNTMLNVAAGAIFDANGYAQAFSLVAGTGAIDVGTAGITVTPDGTNTYHGTLTGSGGLTKSGTGTLVLRTDSTFTGITTIAGGRLQLGDGTTTGSVTGNIVNHGELAFNRIGATSYDGVISGSGSVTKAGSGTLTLTGTHTYTGATSVASGTLVIDGSAATSAFAVEEGATLTGSGTIGSLALTSGAILAPGNSPGTLFAGNSTWQGGANYLWEINDATGVMGTNWDLVSISGSLTINATAADRFTLSLVSLLANHTSGDVLNFDAAQNYSYTIASASGGIIGFNADAFTINANGFTNALNGGSWDLAHAGNNLTLNFTAAAIPEPSTYVMVAGVAVLGSALLRRHRQRR